MYVTSVYVTVRRTVLQKSNNKNISCDQRLSPASFSQLETFILFLSLASIKYVRPIVCHRRSLSKIRHI